MDKMQQKILCIESKKLFEKGKWNGLISKNLQYYYKLLKDNSEFKVRDELENNPDYKQIIPQAILRNKDRYFLHCQRDANEKRLNSLCPLPLGGHVEEFDVKKGKDTLEIALDREIEEEANIDANIVSKKFLGIIYVDDENPVNAVHVGIFYVFDIDSRDVEMREEGLETIGWVDGKYLREHIDKLTFWSRVFVKECL
jgi:predicted NUDIX family phosphoesterase